MAKFVIDKVIIDSSAKDIETGAVREFCDGFNLIFGENEKGKSSLMSFIKDGLFRIKGQECGKINFKIKDENSSQNYRADIKQNKISPNQRCVIINENNNTEIDYSIIEKSINKNYFNEAFLINLDDLMKVQAKDDESFINAIKDPAGDRLNLFLKDINSEISKYLSSEKKPKKEIKEIIEKINNLNLELRELSKKESSYIEAISAVKNLDEEIKEIFSRQNALEAQKKLADINSELKICEIKKSSLISKFNNKFFENKEKYLNILQLKGVFESNLNNINKNNEKINNHKQNILEAKSVLKKEYDADCSDGDISGFSFDNDKNKKIKDAIEKINELKGKINLNELKIENLKEDILKLKINCENVSFDENKNKELVFLNSEIEENLELYRNLTVEAEKLSLNSSDKTFDKKSFIMFCGILTIGITAFVLGLYFKSFINLAFGVLISFVSFLGAIFTKNASKKGNTGNSKEIENLYFKRKEVLNNLKSKLQKHYPEISEFDDLKLSLKFEASKRDIQEQIKDFEGQKKELIQKQTEIKEKEALIKEIAEVQNAETENKIKELETGCLDLINKDLNLNTVLLKDYFDIFEIIKSLKFDLNQKNVLEAENEDLKKQNSQILSDFSNFILQNDIEINPDADFSNMIEQLKEFALNNDSIKTELDSISKEIKIKLDEINEINQNNDFLKFKDDIGFENPENEINNLLILKEQKTKEREQALVAKNILEEFEGISDIKIQKEYEILKYQKIIKKIFINETVLSLCKRAKESLEKKQPDLVNAQKFLSVLTDNKYNRINLELREISNESGSIVKKWENLSRGTKEQLYLALRLGYASNYSKDKTTLKPNGKLDLPLIIDDAFVNFDSKRIKNALLCLLAFSKTNQVLFFTCHENIISKYLENEPVNKIFL